MASVHDEKHYLSRWYENVAPHVDGIVILDDRSGDGSGEYLAQQPKVLEVQRIDPDPARTWDEAYNHRVLVEMAKRHGADWVVGIDPDERVEREFRQRAEQWITWASRRRVRALAVHIRDLWGSPGTIRVDGWWGQKNKAVLFRAKGRMSFDSRPLHGSWAPFPPPRKVLGRHASHPIADLIVYHCKMITPEGRRGRWARYKALDPEARWNRRGYDYLLDEEGLELRPLPAGRDYLPLEPV